MGSKFSNRKNKDEVVKLDGQKNTKQRVLLISWINNL